jgi:nucleoside 2-deoxyribosyltransferase
MKKTCYVACAMSGRHDAEVVAWQQQATDLLHEHFNVLTPSIDVAPFQHDRAVEIVARDFAMIDRCDVLLADCTRPSAGVAQEILHAYQAGKLVVAMVMPDQMVSPFIIAHAAVLVGTLEFACRAAIVGSQNGYRR